LDADYTSLLSSFAAQFPSVPAPKTHRMHCIGWSDYDTQPQTELRHGMRLDTSYYYWPPTWVNDVPGLFTGSGIPMRFTDRNGNIIDVYQATTQMTDESGQSYPLNIDTLLDNAVGATGYYGAFVVQAHNDGGSYPGIGNEVVDSAQTHNVPVVSALQMLTWLDGRNSSSFGSLSFSAGNLTFTIAVGTGARNLQAMLPTSSPAGTLTSITLSGSPVGVTTQTIKGVQYALFTANAGSYQAKYGNGGGSPVVGLSPTSLAFANQSVGTTSAARPVTLSNTGSAALTINGISITGTNSTSFAQNNNCGTSVAAGASCTVNVTFTPSAASALTATLSVADNAAGSPHTAALTGTGIAGAPAASLSPTSLAFGNQVVNTASAAKTVTLTNTGTAALTITGYSFAGTNSTSFSQTHTCGAMLAAGANCSISVSFTPSTTGAVSASLAVADNAAGSPQTVALTGTGTAAAPAVSLSPTSEAFGNQVVNTTSAARTVTLTNTGTAALTIAGYSFTGTNPADFAQTHTCGATLAAGANCTISVTFTPSATGARSARLSIADNAAGSPQTVTLTGTGAGTPVVSLSPTSLAFGNQAVNTASAAKVVTLTNTGSGTLTITGYSFAGTNPTNFSQTHTCGSTLVAAASCTISVRFTPSATGPRSASLSITDNAAGSPQTVTLTGMGTGPAVNLLPTSLSFGNQALNTTSAAKTVTLTNTGTATLNIAGYIFTGTNPTNFSQTHTCGTTLVAGASCTISVTFRPSARSSRTATLNVIDNAAGSPQTVTLSGTGT
ncbi:MAG: choice-of-anchor D domain-containing protein, partial [Terriglobales bacterium]